MGQWLNHSTEPSLQHGPQSFFLLTCVPVKYSSSLFVPASFGDDLQYQIQEAEADIVHGWLQHPCSIHFIFHGSFTLFVLQYPL